MAKVMLFDIEVCTDKEGDDREDLRSTIYDIIDYNLGELSIKFDISYSIKSEDIGA